MINEGEPRGWVMGTVLVATRSKIFSHKNRPHGSVPIARLLRYYIIFHMQIFFNDLHALLIAEFSGI